MKKTLAIILTLALCLPFASVLAGEKLVVGATPVPHEQLLTLVKDDLAAAGFDLEVLTFTDYVLPNPATASGELNANYFQHIPYLNLFNAEAKEEDKLEAVIPVHYEPYGLYAGTKKDLKDLAEGDKIAITNDPSNETRERLLLRDAGLIELPKDATWESALTVQDIVKNDKKLEILEVNAELIPASLNDVAFAVINGNFAIGAGLNPAKDALYLEAKDSESAKIYTNYVVVKKADATAPFVEALKKALHSQKVYDYITTSEEYKGGVIPAFTPGE